MKEFPLWLRISLIHPAFSIFLLVVAKALQHAGADFASMAHAASLFGIVINAPGVIVLRQLLVFTHHPKTPSYLLLLLIILLTWGIIVAPFCWLINWVIVSRRDHE